MSSVTAKTADLFDAMTSRIVSINGNLDESNRTAQRGSGVQQEEVSALIEAGLQDYRSGKLEEAAEYCRRALRIFPESRVVLYSLGVIAGQLRRFEESKAAFNQLVRLLEGSESIDPPTLARSHQGLGAALLGLWVTSGPREPPLELAREGEIEFRRALALDPNFFEAWMGLGLALHMQERLEDAEAAFRKGLEIDPDSQVAAGRLRSVLEDKLERRLFELGYLSRINKPIRDFTPYENRTPIRVEGKPLSEIIVEERR